MKPQRRRQGFYAEFDVPADVRDAFGGKRRLVRSLETRDIGTAKTRIGLYATEWRTQVAQARAQKALQSGAALEDLVEPAWRPKPRELERRATDLRRQLRQSDPADRTALLSVIGEEAAEISISGALQAGVLSESDPEFEGLSSTAAARRFKGLATGQLAPFAELLDDYLGILRCEPKSAFMRASTVRRFAEAFPTLSDVSRRAVQQWADGELKEGKAVATIRRSLSELRGYWSYMASRQAVPEDAAPFDSITLPRSGKADRSEQRAAFDAKDVVRLHKAAQERGDGQLADLITLAMWTGARIEELCALRTEKVKADHILIVDAKSGAGDRTVPIHSRLAPVVERLKSASADGYLLSGLTTTKFDDRSNAIGKRFGRLKTSLGFGPEHVFHSIRKTVATLLENAGVPENVAADIIGHEKPTMTYGLYSGGSSLTVRGKAIELIEYPHNI